MEPLDPWPGKRREPGRFVTTRWSLVLAAGGKESDSSRSAMGRLVETYWYPLYAFARRKGRGPEEACDLTQEFLLGLLDRRFLGDADPQKGRFRTFLLTAFERFLVAEWRRGSREKRGGGCLTSRSLRWPQRNATVSSRLIR
jgi:DNA-directed RNA polymerase specialized sigma24 family protein